MTGWDSKTNQKQSCSIWQLKDKKDKAIGILQIISGISARYWLEINLKTQVDKGSEKTSSIQWRSQTKFHKVREIFFQKILLNLRNTYEKQKIAYRLLAYGITTKIPAGKILVVQKRLLRNMFFKETFDSISDILCR